MYIDQFFHDLERLERKREDMLRYLLEKGHVSVADDNPRLQVCTIDECAPVATLKTDIGSPSDLVHWFDREGRRLIHYHRREFFRSYERDRYMYGCPSSYLFREEEIVTREMELAVIRSREFFISRMRQEEHHHRLQRHMIQPPPPFTSLPPPNMAECQSLTVVQKARNLFIPKDEKLLRKSGLKDANGNWTNDSIRVFVEMLLEDKDNKKKLLDLAKELTSKKKEEDDE